MDGELILGVAAGLAGSSELIISAHPSHLPPCGLEFKLSTFPRSWCSVHLSVAINTGNNFQSLGMQQLEIKLVRQPSRATSLPVQ